MKIINVHITTGVFVRLPIKAAEPVEKTAAISTPVITVNTN